MSSITAAQVDPKVQLRQVVETIGKEPEAFEQALALVQRISPTVSNAMEWQELEKRLVTYKTATLPEQTLLSHGIRNTARRLMGVYSHLPVSDSSLAYLTSLSMDTPNLQVDLSQQMETAIATGNIGQVTNLMHLYELDVNELNMRERFSTLIWMYQSDNLPLHLLSIALGATPLGGCTHKLAMNTATNPAWAPVLKAYSSTMTRLNLYMAVQLPLMDILFDAGYNPSIRSLNEMQPFGAVFIESGQLPYAPALAFNGVDVEKTTLMDRIPRMQIAVNIRNDFFAQHTLGMATLCRNVFPNVIAPFIVEYARTNLEDVSFEARQKDKTAVTLFKDMRAFCYLMLEARELSFTQDNWVVS
jgi:hypothetical protein